MITRLDAPDGIVVLKADGDVTKADYENVVIPAVDAATAGDRKARLVYIFEEGTDIKGSAAWSDAKLGLEHFNDFARIALVTDRDVLRGLVVAFGWLIPGKVKGFERDELDQAIAWAGVDD